MYTSHFFNFFKLLKKVIRKKLQNPPPPAPALKISPPLLQPVTSSPPPKILIFATPPVQQFSKIAQKFSSGGVDTMQKVLLLTKCICKESKSAKKHLNQHNVRFLCMGQLSQLTNTGKIFQKHKRNQQLEQRRKGKREINQLNHRKIRKSHSNRVFQK